MSTIYKEGTYYGKGGGEGNTVSVELTQAEYDALPTDKKNNGTVYYITDSIPESSKMATCGFTPIGTIISVMGNSAPNNYLACNGQIVNIDEFPELAEYFEEQFGSVNYFGGDGETTFGLPDLRGEFLRGTGTNSHENQGSGANVGEHQDATEIVRISVGNNVNLYGTPSINNEDSSVGENVKNKAVALTSGAQENTPLYTTRPTNTSVLYCIAVRNIYVDARYDYSTDEKVVGTWIDGKPLYQKTVVDTMPNVVTAGTYVTKYVTLGLVDIDSIFLVNAFCVDENNYARPMPYTLNNGNQSKVAVNKTQAQVSSSILEHKNKPLYFTIQYTKTTE